MSLAAHLATLGPHELTRLLECRSDVLVEPVPGNLAELADRLASVDSLARVLPELDRDAFSTLQAAAWLEGAGVETLAPWLRSPEAAVAAVVDRLSASGLAWLVEGRVTIPDRLTAHFGDELVGFRPLAAVVRQTRVEDLRVALAGLGEDPAGLTKPRLVERLAAVLGSPDSVRRAVAALPAPAARHLGLLLQSGGMLFGSFGPGPAGPQRALVQAGLLVDGPYNRAELPREVAVVLLLDRLPAITGRPEVPLSADHAGVGRAGADAAVLVLTGLLDEAVDAPLARLKKGGIGTRERARLAGRIGTDEPALWIDIAHGTGLLRGGPQGYAASGDFPEWRDEPGAARWASAALAWYRLEHSPTHRLIEDGEVPPPQPMDSAGGMLRRAVLRAAAGGRSVRAAGAVVDWWCPLHPYTSSARQTHVDAALREAALLGVVEGDRLSELGELLVEHADRPDGQARLASEAAEKLPQSQGLLVLQSDLTAVVSGQVSAAAARLLAACAVPDARGAATTWRFGPVSVRGALDAGWTVDELREQLGAVSGRPLPQPLDYLLTDVARRHGSVRVRQAGTCIVGAEAEVAEILHTRSLAKLKLHRLAPTVLAAPGDVEPVLAALRKAGFAPMPETADGVVGIPQRKQPPAEQRALRAPRPRVAAGELASRLLHAPRTSGPASESFARLRELGPQLDPAEVVLLADALDNGRDVRIRYRNKDGNHSVRDIAPKQLYGRWIEAWCYLRSGDRDFSVSGIETVGPVG